LRSIACTWGIPAGFSSLPVKAFAMEKKNPLPAGLFNMLVPGSGYWYVNRDRGRFSKTLIIGVFVQTLL
jgi:hypothetical protein